MFDPIRAALERLVELDNSSPMQDDQWAWKHENAIADAIEALSAAPPAAGEVGEVTDEALQRTRDEEREACCRWVIENLDLYDPKWVANQLRAHRLGAIAADRVRQTHHTILVPAPMPAPPAAAAGEVEELVALLRYEAREADLDLMTAEQCHRAADLLEMCAFHAVAINRENCNE